MKIIGLKRRKLVYADEEEFPGSKKVRLTIYKGTDKTMFSETINFIGRKRQCWKTSYNGGHGTEQKFSNHREYLQNGIKSWLEIARYSQLARSY